MLIYLYDFLYYNYKMFLKKGAIILKTQKGFTLLNKNEIASYLAKQKVTRKITRLQVQ